jgi:hypothetical protein
MRPSSHRHAAGGVSVAALSNLTKHDVPADTGALLPLFKDRQDIIAVI